MDGSQGKLTNSLQFRLSILLSVFVAVLALAAGGASYWSAFDEAIEMQDAHLSQVANLIDRHALSAVALSLPPDAGIDAELRIFTRVLGDGADADDPNPLDLPASLPDGLQTLTIRGDSWRVHVRQLHTGARLAVAQPSEARDEIARASALRTTLPMLALVPILLAVIGSVVRRALKPVAELARELDERGEANLSPIQDQRVPNEIRPFSASINRLLLRVTASIEGQKRFVADAAHELRSPLTALSLQLEALAGKGMSGELGEQVNRLQKGMQRMRSLLEQLLTLARFEAIAAATPAPTNFLLASVRHVIEEQMPSADAKGIDLGVVTGSEDAQVRGTAFELQALIRNLVDNAIRYTPSGGRVDVGVYARENGPVLEVTDTGPGIPANELERVFDPFYRVVGMEAEGSGLGLSIVKTLARRLNCRVELHNADSGLQSDGLRVVARFPVV